MTRLLPSRCSSVLCALQENFLVPLLPQPGTLPPFAAHKKEERWLAHLLPRPSDRDARLKYNTGPAAGGRAGRASSLQSWDVRVRAFLRFFFFRNFFFRGTSVHLFRNREGVCVFLRKVFLRRPLPNVRSTVRLCKSRPPRVCSRLASSTTVPSSSSSPPPHRHPRQVFEREYNHASELKVVPFLSGESASKPQERFVDSSCPLCRCQREPSTGLSSKTTTSQGLIGAPFFSFSFFFSLPLPLSMYLTPVARCSFVRRTRLVTRSVHLFHHSSRGVVWHA